MKIEAKDLQEALLLAAAELECSVIDIEYEIVQHGKSGFLGVFQRNFIIDARNKKHKFDKAEKFEKSDKFDKKSAKNRPNFSENSRNENRSNSNENREENRRENLRGENRNFENRGHDSKTRGFDENVGYKSGDFKKNVELNRQNLNANSSSNFSQNLGSNSSSNFSQNLGSNSSSNSSEFNVKNSAIKSENSNANSSEFNAKNSKPKSVNFNANSNEFGFDTNSSFAENVDLSDKFKPRQAKPKSDFMDKMKYEVPIDDDFSDIKAVEKPKYKIIANDGKEKTQFNDKFSDRYDHSFNEGEAIFDVGEKPRKDFIDKNSNFKNPAFENLTPKPQNNASKSKYVVRNDQIFNSFHKESDANPALYIDEIKMQLDKLLKAGEFDIKIAEMKVFDEHSIYIKLDGADAALLIGREGYRYKALSYLLHNWINARYNILIRLEIADFLRNQSQTMDFYLRQVIEKVEMLGRAQTKPLDGVLVKIALEKLRAKFPNKYVGIRQNGDEKFVIVNDFFKKDE